MIWYDIIKLNCSVCKEGCSSGVEQIFVYGSWGKSQSEWCQKCSRDSLWLGGVCQEHSQREMLHQTGYRGGVRLQVRTSGPPQVRQMHFQYRCSYIYAYTHASVGTYARTCIHAYTYCPVGVSIFVYMTCTRSSQFSYPSKIVSL